MSEIEELTTAYLDFSKKSNYRIIENKSIIPKDDSTLLLMNSTIALFKKSIQNNEVIPDTALIQDCFRSNGDLNNSSLMLYFKMIGNIAMMDSIDKVLNDLISFFVDICEMPSSQIFGVIHIDDLDLQTAWLESELSGNMVFLKGGENSQYSTRWTYGEGYDFIGRGLTFVYDNPSLLKCCPECDVKCNCSKYIQFGNLIIIESEISDRKYIDTGIGIERLASCNFYNDAYLLPEFKELVDNLVELGFEQDVSKKLINLIRGIFKLIEEEVTPGNKKEGYILKSLIRHLTNEIIIFNDKNVMQIQDVYESIFFIFKNSISEINDKNNIIVIGEMQKYTKSLYKGASQARKFIIKNIDLDDSFLIKKVISTFGLPIFIATAILEDTRE
ncbi:hypothetical protein I6J18_00225 (plasmid) [Peribacillus psychrosaccharolyticus]|uniref:alanine--tRNA ligase n=1 Tax=Peribacillus psychrosaccharolyticus TaxID=1407 RepID=A0A974NIK8_PERPY|nr:alanine--tRNA ligase-related protein [Peribacillus psychrosaccharolyticus]MEC2054228.1 alanine--tRNA ligase-related protein [Peribacillus psychrosaccharolyticus]MED3746579.1 alanine--tRNA ligase-related protein [Peribacillus psychrosaccharolyticus]QQS98416.1 hypothetical protein I6J18_00225 [Peribacillus psychrosaccharolyticus]